MSDLRIACLVPSATDLVAALGLGDAVVGVSHECDHPLAEGKPVLTRSRVPAAGKATGGASPGDVDAAVGEALAAGESLYVADRELLASLRPDIVVSQDACDVCAVALAQARCDIPPGSRLLGLEATGLEGLRDDLRQVAAALGVRARGDEVVAELDAAIGPAGAAEGPRVLALEWGDPPFTSGHWVPELLAHGGARSALGGPGEASRRATWDEVRRTRPDVVVHLPCGYGLDTAQAEAEGLDVPGRLGGIGAALYAADANALFSRCTPQAVVAGVRAVRRVVEGSLAPGERGDGLVRLR